MEINIFAFSDCHGKLARGKSDRWKTLPIDLVIGAGDIANTSIKNISINNGQRELDRETEKEEQRVWINKALKPWLKRKNWYDKFIIINGNHDWVEYEKYFKNACTNDSKTIKINIRGKEIKIGLLCGIPIIPSGGIRGGWNDEVWEDEYEKRINQIDRDIDILVSHAPSYGVLDLAYSERIGFRVLYKAIFGSSFSEEEPYFNKLKVHVFGHAHEEGRQSQREKIGEREVLFVNCATGYENFTINS